MAGPWEEQPKSQAADARPTNARFERWKAEQGIVEDADSNLVSEHLVRSLRTNSMISLLAALLGSLVAIWAVRVARPNNGELRDVALFGMLVVAANAAFHLWRHGRRTTRAILANRRTGFTSSFALLMTMDVLALLVPLAAAAYMATPNG